MAVSATVNPIISPIGSGIDPRLPYYTWIVQKTLAGDVSGGDATITVTPSNSNLEMAWSIDGITFLFDGPAADVIARVEFDTKQSGNENATFDFQDAVLCRKVSASAADARAAVRYDYTPIFVPAKGNAWTLDIAFANPGAAKNMRITAWGYGWNLASINIPGGLVRPGQFPAPLV